MRLDSFSDKRAARPAVADTATPPQQPTRRRWSLAGRWRWAGVLLPIVILGGVEVLVRAQILPDNLVPAPSEIALSLWQMGPERLARSIGAG